MTQKELHMKEFFEWTCENYDSLKMYYDECVAKKSKQKMPLTMFTIATYCNELDIARILHESDWQKIKKIEQEQIQDEDDH
jgi:hypothetical protein